MCSARAELIPTRATKSQMHQIESFRRTLEHPGVNAPGTPNITTVLVPTCSARLILSPGDAPYMVTEGTASPTCRLCKCQQTWNTFMLAGTVYIPQTVNSFFITSNSQISRSCTATSARRDRSSRIVLQVCLGFCIAESGRCCAGISISKVSVEPQQRFAVKASGQASMLELTAAPILVAKRLTWGMRAAASLRLLGLAVWRKASMMYGIGLANVYMKNDRSKRPKEWVFALLRSWLVVAAACTHSRVHIVPRIAASRHRAQILATNARVRPSAAAVPRSVTQLCSVEYGTTHR